MQRRFIFLTLFISLFIPFYCFAHPSPIDFGNIHRHELGILLSVGALLFSILFYTITGLRKSNRATTVGEYFLYEKKASLNQYFNTTVGYNFQVVVTIYFIYLGFNYGVWIFSYAFTWLLGFYLFQKFSPKLIEFIGSNTTLHGYLSNKFNLNAIKKITALLTIFGLLGGLLIEVNYTTDLINSISQNTIGNISWVIIYLLFILITWYYVQYGGFKATVNIASVQLPVIYISLSIIFTYLVYLCYRNGDPKHGLIIGIMLSIAWGIVWLARKKTLKSQRDLATLSSIFGLFLTLFTTLVLTIKYGIHSNTATEITDLPNSFNFVEGFRFQDKLVFIGFAILNLTWQFFDMSAWQRLSSINTVGLNNEEKKQKIRAAIGETKYESPVTWVFGILFGIGLHHSGLFNSASQAYDSFNIFIQTLAHNDFDKFLGMLSTYIILPCVVIAFFGIALSTTDCFLNAITFAYINDLSKFNLNSTESEKRVQDSILLKHANRFALLILLIFSIIFLFVKLQTELDILVLLNVFYSAQFLICFFTFTALLLKRPQYFSKWVTATVLISLLVNLITAFYCYYKMKNSDAIYWSDWFYVLPTISCTVAGIILIGIGLYIKRKKLFYGL